MTASTPTSTVIRVKEFEFNKDELRNQMVEQAQKAAEKDAQERDQATDGARRGLTPSRRPLSQPEVTPEDILYHMKGAWKLFRFKIIPFSSLASTRIQRAMVLEQFADNRLHPGSMVLEEAGFDNPKELQAQAAKEMQEKQAMGFPPLLHLNLVRVARSPNGCYTELYGRNASNAPFDAAWWWWNAPRRASCSWSAWKEALYPRLRRSASPNDHDPPSWRRYEGLHRQHYQPHEDPQRRRPDPPQGLRRSSRNAAQSPWDAPCGAARRRCAS